jgi:hypothetical protein
VGSEIRVTTSTDQWIEAEAGYIPQDENLLFGFKDGADLEEKLSPILEASDPLEQVRDLFGKTK